MSVKFKKEELVIVKKLMKDLGTLIVRTCEFYYLPAEL